MTEDRIGTLALKTVLDEFQNKIAQIEREQSLLSMRVALACSELSTIACALDSWYATLTKLDSERKTIDI
jgi:hypothetical protein